MANPWIAEGVVLQKPFHIAIKDEINVHNTHTHSFKARGVSLLLKGISIKPIKCSGLYLCLVTTE